MCALLLPEAGRYEDLRGMSRPLRQSQDLLSLAHFAGKDKPLPRRGCWDYLESFDGLASIQCKTLSQKTKTSWVVAQALAGK